MSDSERASVQLIDDQLPVFQNHLKSLAAAATDPTSGVDASTIGLALDKAKRSAADFNETANSKLSTPEEKEIARESRDMMKLTVELLQQLVKETVKNGEKAPTPSPYKAPAKQAADAGKQYEVIP